MLMLSANVRALPREIEYTRELTSARKKPAKLYTHSTLKPKEEEEERKKNNFYLPFFLRFVPIR